MSYNGGYCFKCGTFRPSKRSGTLESESMDLVDYLQKGVGRRINEASSEGAGEEYHGWTWKAKMPKLGKSVKWRSIEINEHPSAELLLQTIVSPYGQTEEGSLVHALEIPWAIIVQRLTKNWSEAFTIPPRIWEEIIAAAFDQDGYDEVTLTPRSGDHGRDVIAVKKGVGCIRIIDSVKAYKPGHLVTHDDVRALAGVLHADPRASKGILSTTSDFAPTLKTDPFMAPLMPYRLELMNGRDLRHWLSNLSQRN